MTPRSFTAQRLIARTPWDVYEFLADDANQTQWRQRHEKHATLVDAQPYTRIEYSGGFVFTIEPQEENTLLTLTRTTEGKAGALNRLAVKLMSRKVHEEEMVDQLARIESSLVYDL